MIALGGISVFTANCRMACVDEPILILGAGGFIGRQLALHLAQCDEHVIAVGRRPFRTDHANIETVLAEPRSAEDFVPLLERSRAVIHLASGSTPGSTAGRPLDEAHHNLIPIIGLLQALQDVPDRTLTFVSSAGTLYGDTDGAASRETDPLRPRSYHGAGKVAAEAFIHAWCSQFSAAATVLRPSNVYGPGQTERHSFGIVPTAFGKLLRGEALTVWGDGSAVRDFLYIDDFVNLCRKVVLSRMPTGLRIANAASGSGTSLNTLFANIENVSGRSLPRHYDASRHVDVARVVIDPTDARALFDWEPSTTLEDGLQRTWQWFSTTPH
jgi:UDP-glucose 4-epimerase